MNRFAIGRTIALVIGFGLLASPVQADPRPAPAAPAVFPYGVSWYPEWVPEASWDTDLAMMQAAGITYVRMGEFAWSTLEPAEGQYDFGWLDRALNHVAAHGMKALLGTPTAGPPAWLTRKYPDTLVVEANGQRAEHGGRRHGSITSATYRIKAAGIASALGQRYGRNPTVIGFQIDNEFGRKTYDDATRAAFRTWLRARYGSLDRLNTAWFGSYWSRTFSDWDQIAIPDGKYSNPPHWLDWLRFHSENVRDYQANQIAALRPHLVADKILTTNFVAMYDDFDFSLPAQDLDVVGWDFYAEDARLDPAEGAMLHDLYRGFLGRNPWVLEATPINIVYVPRNHAPPRGQVRAMVWQAIGHGADSYSFWPWQTPPGGNEPLHGSLVDTLRRPRITYDEISRAGREIARAWPVLRGTEPVAEAAMLHDFPGRWALKREPLTVDYDPWTLTVAWHRAFAPTVAGIAVLRGLPALARYKLVIAPAMPLIDDAGIAALTAYVAGGGHLVVGPRGGSRTPDAAVREPAAFDAILGARVEHYQVPPKPVALSGMVGDAVAAIWGERLKIEAADVQILLRYGVTDDYLNNGAAVVTRRHGKGRITYVGAWLDAAGMAAVARWTASEAGAAPLVANVPVGVEVTARAGGGTRALVVINWSDVRQAVALPRLMTDVLHGGSARMIELEPRDVAVIKE